MRLRHANAYRLPSALEALAVDIMIYDIYIYIYVMINSQ